LCFKNLSRNYSNLHSPFWNKKVRLKEKKSIPDPKQVMHNFFEAYKYRWNKLDNKAKEEFIWFTCSVLLAVQKAWKPFAPTIANHTLKFLVVWMKPLNCSS